jgi:hypothetical protein
MIREDEDNPMTTDRAPSSTTPAGDDEPILEALQERMDRIIRGESPNSGRFCGYCYARLERDDTDCPLCGRAVSEVAPVARVTRDVLRVYNAHRRKMQLWVNTFAFTGIFLAIVISGVIVALFPYPWNFLAVVTLFFGSWYLANLLGGGIGGMLGIRQGSAVRSTAWRELLQRRAAGENLDAR